MVTDEMVEAALNEGGSGWGMHLDRDAKRWLMRAALEAALSAQVQDVAGWQPIETADKDAPRLLLGIVRRDVLEEAHIGGYRYAINDDEVSCWWSDQADDEIVPTHWMPLPASPAKQEG